MKSYNLNSNKETLLPLLWLNPSALNNRISTTNPDPLRSSRTFQMKHISNIPLLTRSLQRITYSEEDRTTHKQWRFTDTTRALDRTQIFPLNILEQTDIEDLRDITETGYLVVTRASGEDLAG